MMIGAGLLRRFLSRPADEPAEEMADTFARLYAAHFDQLYAYIRYRVGDGSLAEDLTAETFTRLWTRREEVCRSDAVVPWLFTTARHLVFDHYRRRRYTLSFDELSSHLHPTTSDLAQAHEHLDLVLAGLATLREREREIVILRFVAGLRNSEIAPILGTSEGNVAKILHRTLKQLRSHLCVLEHPTTPPAGTEEAGHV